MSAKIELVRDVELLLAEQYSVDDAGKISEILIKALADYDVEKSCREIVPYDSLNDKLLKQFSACLFVSGKSEKTIRQYIRTCHKLIETVGKNLPEMGVYDIRYFLACEKSRGISNRTVENSRSYISSFFQWMTKEDIIPKNPCAKIDPIKYDNVIRKPFSDVEIDALRMSCKSKKERAIIELLLSSGIRVSELSDLKITDINEMALTVHVVKGKGGKGRVTYLTAVAMKHLKDYWGDRKEEGIMAFYNNQHKKLNPGGIRHILNGIGKRAKVENVHPHRFRRTFATGLATRGMEVQEIQKLLGHTNISTTMEYVYMSDEKTSASYRKHIA